MEILLENYISQVNCDASIKQLFIEEHEMMLLFYLASTDITPCCLALQYGCCNITNPSETHLISNLAKTLPSILSISFVQLCLNCGYIEHWHCHAHYKIANYLTTERKVMGGEIFVQGQMRDWFPVMRKLMATHGSWQLTAVSDEE